MRPSTYHYLQQTTKMNNKISIDTIETLARAYARARSVLSERVQLLDEELRRVNQSRRRGIKAALNETLDAKAKLETAVSTNRYLFTKPKTVTIDGIRVGLMKQKGKIEYSDEAQVIKLIRKVLPEQADVLIQHKESVVKSALGSLSTAELKKIGCSVKDADESVVIKPQDSDLDKLLEKLLDGSNDENDDEA
jgi:hypothetical protein